MQTQTQPTANDREDARRALDLYVRVRTEKQKAALDVILQLWGTPNWSIASRSLFLLAIRNRQECDARIKNLACYTPTTIQSYYKMQLAYRNRERDQDAA